MYSGGMTRDTDTATARGNAIRALAAAELAQIEREERRASYRALPGFLVLAAALVYVACAYLLPLVLGWLP